jgi:uncharacterized integral membrane protein (TIGR00698 family)
LKLLPSKSEALAAWPGLALVVIPIVLASETVFWLEQNLFQTYFHAGAPIIALMIAAVISIVATNVVELPSRYSEGLQFSTRWLLRVGIVLYGLNFTYSLWFKPGSFLIFVIGALSVAIPLVSSNVLGRLLGLKADSRTLVGVGTAICGISAIVATQQAIESDDTDAGMSIATILLFGTFVLFAYPVIEALMGLGAAAYGVWTGATTLDLPQLVAAAVQGGGEAALPSALWVKSIRIGLLVPVIILLVFLRKRGSSPSTDGKAGRFRLAAGTFPIFILAFFGAILLNTILSLPSWIISPLASGGGIFLNLSLANLLLTSAIVGVCFRVRADFIDKTGWKFILLGGIAWAIQSVIILWLVIAFPQPTL